MPLPLYARIRPRKHLSAAYGNATSTLGIGRMTKKIALFAIRGKKSARRSLNNVMDDATTLGETKTEWTRTRTTKTRILGRIEECKLDLKEREEFADRVRQKDKHETKKMVEDRSSKTFGAQEAAERRRLADDTAGRVAAMLSLRERSRQTYLSKRELQQIALLRREIADDEALTTGAAGAR